MKYKITAIAALLAVAFISFAVTGISGDTVDAKGEKKGASVEFSVSLFGDPDFDAFSANELAARILTAANIGSSGIDGVKTTPSPDFAVDSFFDITYRIEFGSSDGKSAPVTTISIEAQVTVLNPDVDPSAVVDNVGDAFAADKKKEYIGHVTLIR